MQNIYPENFETKIGFDRIRELLHNKCLSTMGNEWVDEMHFQDSFEIISNQLGEVKEFCRIIREIDTFPANHFYDLRSALKKIEIEGRFLEASELFDLKRSLESVRAIILFFNKQEEEIFPLLKKKTADVQLFPYIYDRVDNIINKFGKIRDNASSALSQIRKNILLRQSNMSKRLHHILKQAQKDGLVDEDATVSIRDGRAVIPIASGNKRKLKGIIYDESATGKTSYVEPNEIVEMNNEIRELEYAERREIVKILTNFSNDIRPYLEELFYSYDFLGEIDFIRAKAMLAIEFNAINPEFSNEAIIDWKHAVHPLLMKTLKKENRKIVPLNIKLTSEKHILLISGPNAGGKSVCLKTVGLLQYMLQCGLLIPVNESSKTGIFSQLFIDIGDEQSLENDLSTYSSHLLNMKHFVKNSNEKTLILIDEFGTGTEPMLGGAIAESILDKLNQLQTFGVITTHYTNLKHFASSASGIVNGAMLYDSQNMNPLFQLEIGKPGSSFAFEIARKIGLPEDILDNATEKIGKDHIDFDRNLRKINRDKHYWETKRQKIRKVEKILDEMAANYEEELKETKKLRKVVLAKAKEDADLLLSGVNKKIENTIHEIRKAQAEKEKTKLERQKLDQLKKDVIKKTTQSDEHIDKKIKKLREREKRRNQNRPEESKITVQIEKPEEHIELQPGDKVRIKGQNTIGDLIEINLKNAVVAFGQLITTLPRVQIERLSNNEAKNLGKNRKSGTSRLAENFSEKRLTFKPEIDIRGQRVEEAISKVTEFIDEAIMFEVGQLRILHGKGHGILKETIREFLRSEPMVKNFKDEHVDFGGAGITVVNLAL
ncbi:MAG: endonuclease MutS2 [Prolixibacteraceae bacterium]|jgi:DNA mismatch repair protein MutS2|nr:endonuclease MutS2 [Prolixibacteraceae bacterium]MBT6765268.1 endonuclease MutS2 [Prolixibacteraceae bacterium]MBT6997800.1 endonuclease MutS2 [Prolixibacteraceae bacterium]MBT7396795.1 endonuclease MutS2 [Prolixibacteraceae bacterium]